MDCDLAKSLLLPECLQVQSWHIQGNILSVTVRGRYAEGRCPLCHVSTVHVHARYYRYPEDLPCSGRRVRLAMEVRRFQCRNPACRRRTFSETFPIVAPMQRRTQRLHELFWYVGLALGGMAGARLARRLGIPISGETILRTLKRMAPLRPSWPVSAPQKIGIDDWAFRRGHRYGTMVVDLDSHRPVELLGDRDTATVASWLANQRQIGLVARDRAGAYAEAIWRSAPQAVQVADRWHLLKNLGDTLERLLARCHRDVREAARQLAAHAASATPIQPAVKLAVKASDQLSLQRRERRLARYEQAMALRHRGIGVTAIARSMKLERRTVYGWLRAGTFPERGPRSPAPSKLDPYLPYLHQRWQQGCHNAAALTREIIAKGYRGGESLLRQRLRVWRQTGPQVSHSWPLVVPSTRSARVWLLGLNKRDPAQAQENKQFVAQLCNQNPQIAVARRLALHFIAMMRKELPSELAVWIRQARQCGVVELRRFAGGLERDYDAVLAALTTSYSNGLAEGHINRLKTIKRQMYGRASLKLLRIQVLYGES
jgi:transposase